MLVGTRDAMDIRLVSDILTISGAPAYAYAEYPKFIVDNRIPSARRGLPSTYLCQSRNKYLQT